MTDNLDSVAPWVNWTKFAVILPERLTAKESGRERCEYVSTDCLWDGVRLVQEMYHYRSGEEALTYLYESGIRMRKTGTGARMHIGASASSPHRVAFGVAVALTLSWFTAAQAQSCAPDSVAPECLLQRSQDEFQQADDELNRTYQKVLKSMSRPRDEYVNYPVLKVKFVEAQRQWVRFLGNECTAWYLINEAGADRNIDLLTCQIDRTRDRTRELNAWLKQVSHD